MRGPKNSHNDLPASFIQQLFEYNESTGLLSWAIQLSKRATVGKIAGWTDDQGRIKIGIQGKDYFAHRIIWVWMTGKWPKYEIDHVDENKSNNQWKNLREATPSQNHRNRGRQKNNTSGYKGVCFDNTRKKWFATINIRIENRKKHIHLGWYPTAKEAYDAYCDAAIKIHGKDWVHF